MGVGKDTPTNTANHYQLTNMLYIAGAFNYSRNEEKPFIGHDKLSLGFELTVGKDSVARKSAMYQIYPTYNEDKEFQAYKAKASDLPPITLACEELTAMITGRVYEFTLKQSSKGKDYYRAGIKLGNKAYVNLSFWGYNFDKIKKLLAEEKVPEVIAVSGRFDQSDKDDKVYLGIMVNTLDIITFKGENNGSSNEKKTDALPFDQPTEVGIPEEDDIAF